MLFLFYCLFPLLLFCFTYYVSLLIKFSFNYYYYYCCCCFICFVKLCFFISFVIYVKKKLFIKINKKKIKQISLINFFFVLYFSLQNYGENWRWNAVLLLQWRYIFIRSTISWRGFIRFNINRTSRSLTINLIFY